MLFDRFKKSVVVGAEEIYSNGTTDLTEGEQLFAAEGAGIALGGGIGMGVAAVVPAAASCMVFAKGLVVIGSGMVVGAFGKAFTRGFSEEWRAMKAKAESDVRVAKASELAAYVAARTEAEQVADGQAARARMKAEMNARREASIAQRNIREAEEPERVKEYAEEHAQALLQAKYETSSDCEDPDCEGGCAKKSE